MAAINTANAGSSTSENDTFLFINITGPTDGRRREASTQRKIRQHVMRDAAKGSRNLPRDPRSKQKTAMVRRGGSSNDKSNLNSSKGLQPTTTLDVTLEAHPLVVLCQRLMDSSNFPAYSLVYTVLNAKFDYTRERNFLFPFAFSEATFRNTSPSHQKAKEIVRSSSEQSFAIALHRFTNVLSCIRSRLASSDPRIALSDETMLAVIDSICYNFAMEDLAQARCHLDGLYMVINSRGGLSSFSEKTNIQLMIFWVDVTAALIFERAPRFPLPVNLLPARLCTGTSVIWDLSQIVREVEPQSDLEQGALFDALREAASVAKSIESELFTRGNAAWHDPVFLGCQVNPMAHRLLSTSEEDLEKKHLPISMAIRLGIALFIIILKQQSQSCLTLSTPCVSKVIRSLCQITPKQPPHIHAHLFTLQLWILLLCVIAYPNTTLLPEIRNMIMETIKTARLRSWDEVLDTAHLLPWVSRFECREGFGKNLIHHT